MSNQDINSPVKIILKQHNAITEASYDMSALEKNILYVLISKLKNDDPENKIYEIRVKELEEMTKSQTNYTYLRQSTKKLINRLYTIHEKDKNEILQLAPLMVAKYKKGSGTLFLRFSDEIRPFFFALKNNYTLLQFQTAMKLKSKYSKRIYEMISQFKNTGVFKIPVQELKKRFGLVDPQSGKEEYEKFGLFAKNVLEVARKEINENTDLSFEYITKKTGRKITDLKFIIRSREVLKELAEASTAAPQVSPLEERLHKQCKDIALATKVMKSFPVEEVEWVMKGILKKYHEGKIENLAAYSKKIFTQWLTGSKPNFEKTNIPRKYTYPSVKQSTQNGEQDRMSESEIINKLKFKFKIKDEETYGLVYQYGLEPKNLEKLEHAIVKLDKMIYQEKVDINSVLQMLEKELKIEVKDFNAELTWIWVNFCEGFHLGPVDIKPLIQTNSLQDLTNFITEIKTAIKQGETKGSRHSILQIIKEKLARKKVDVEGRRFDQSLVTQANERSNSVNTIGSLMKMALANPNMQAESTEEKKIRTEKTGIWIELTSSRFKNINDEEANDFVEEYCVEALKYAIGQVTDELQNQKIPDESTFIVKELRRHASLWQP